MWLYHWYVEINELLKNSVLDLLCLFCCLLKQCPESTPCPIIKSSIWCLEEKWNYLGIKYQDSGVVKGVTGGQGGTIPRRITMGVTDDCGGRRNISTMPQVGYFLQFSTFASERHQVRTQGRLTCCFPRAPSSLITPLGMTGLTTNHKPTLPSHKSLMDINFR